MVESKPKEECNVLEFVKELNILFQKNPTAIKIKNIVDEYNCQDLMGDATLAQLSLLISDITTTPIGGP